MKKIFPQTMKRMLFACFLCCMLIVNVKAQQGSRYLKETFSDNTIVKYEMNYPELWTAAIDLSDAALNARYAQIEGFVSISKDLKTKTFVLVLNKNRAERLVTKELFNFETKEIISPNK